MTRVFNKIVLLLGFLLISSIGMANTIKCQDYSKEADRLKANASVKQKELDRIDKQVKSNTKAVEEFHKNCGMASKPACNPGMYQIISGQLSTLRGQREKLSLEILNDRSKSEASMNNFTACKEAVRKSLLPVAMKSKTKSQKK